MKKIILPVIFTVSLVASNYNDFQNQYINSYNSYKTQTNQEYKSYKEALEKGFKEYKKSLNEGFKEYKKSLSKYWQNPELTTKTTFVEYSPDKKIKKKVDYKNNQIEIDVIAKNETVAKKDMAKSLISLSTENVKTAFNKNPVLKKVNAKLSQTPKLKAVIINKPVSTEPIVADMIYKTPPKPKQILDYSINSVKKHKIIVKKSKVPNMHVYKLIIKLPPRAFLAKAKIYKNEVFNKAQKFKLPPEFIYAIIHTESSFNPMARSYVPAFGLMQLVPQTAGVEAYKKVYGSKKILTPSYLYNANNNILMGSAYLNILYYRYMKRIKNPISRLYCSIAAYNTGAGNVACAFNSTSKDYRGRTKCIRSRGDYNIYKASKKINQMTSAQVYDYLLKNLRYNEAKNYLKRVSKRMLIYKKALSTDAL